MRVPLPCTAPATASPINAATATSAARWKIGTAGPSSTGVYQSALTGSADACIATRSSAQKAPRSTQTVSSPPASPSSDWAHSCPAHAIPSVPTSAPTPITTNGIDPPPRRAGPSRSRPKRQRQRQRG